MEAVGCAAETIQAPAYRVQFGQPSLVRLPGWEVVVIQFAPQPIHPTEDRGEGSGWCSPRRLGPKYQVAEFALDSFDAMTDRRSGIIGPPEHLEFAADAIQAFLHGGQGPGMGRVQLISLIERN